MSAAPPGRGAVERWLREFGLDPGKPQLRDGVASWDLHCDGRRRSAIPITLILAPGLGLMVWVPFAPPLRDEFRKSYRRLLRWNEEYPFVKFGLTEDERPVLSSEVPLADLEQERLGEALARCVAVCDLLYEETSRWRAGARPSNAPSSSAVSLLERYADRLAELLAPS